MRFQFLKRGARFLTSCALLIGAPHKTRISAFVIMTSMVELAIPLNLFAEALDGFADVNGELIVEMFERKGERYIRLGETAKYNCSD